MLEGKTSDDLRSILLAGASLEINGGNYSTHDLQTIALAIRDGCTLTIRNSKTKSTDDPRIIALAGKGKVKFG